jgi:hypothetical protein
MLTLALAASSARADNGDPLTYYGGPVAHSMTGVIVDWGPSINSLYTNETTGDPGLIKYFAASSGATAGIGGVLAQYVDTSGHNAANSVTYGQQYPITPSVTNATIEDPQVQSELRSQIYAGNLPTPSGNGLSTVYLVLFPAGDTICVPDGSSANGSCSGQAFCAYHGSTELANGTHVLYAVLPDNTSGPMTEGCGGESTLFQDQTSYTSHEWSETITDPLVAEAQSPGPPLSWYDNRCGSSVCNAGEIGDKCSQVTSVQGGWTVQREWSNLDSACTASEPSFSSPTASFVAPAAAAPGHSLRFDGSGSTDPAGDHTSASYGGASYSIPAGLASYAWSWGDSTPNGTGASATHSYAADGNYQVSLTVTDNLGFTSTVTKQVSVSGPSQAAPIVTTTATPPPTVSTGTVTVAGTKATTRGTVNPHGARTSYHFELGARTAYGHSSASVTAGAGNSPVAERATLTGLRPKTRYHYRLVASSAGGTVVGADRTFTTGARAPGAPRFAFSIGHHGSLPTALAHDLIVHFSCSRSCTAHFNVIVALTGITRIAATPRTLARGTGHVRYAGSGRAQLTFTSSARSWLSAAKSVKLVVVGCATGAGDSLTPPKSAPLTLTR